MCKICYNLEKCHKLLIRAHYSIISNNGILECILNDHLKNPLGCSNCIKGYMKQTLFLFAQKFYDHSRFNVECVDGDHLYYQVVMNEKKL